MVTTYRDWQVGDIINICASINEFCGMYSQFIFANDINITKSPDTCTLDFGTEGGCGLHLNNVELTFKLVKVSGSTEGKTCAPQQAYKTIGVVRTNSNGVAGLTYTVTEQDRLDYANASGSGYPYRVMACITNPDGQSLINQSVVSDNINIFQNLCYGVTCSDKCIGRDLYYQTCDPTTGQCVQGTLKEANSSQCLLPSETHYIEYDLSFLPTDFLNFISGNVTAVSDYLGTHLPFPSNIGYIRSEYNSNAGTFRLYVKYTPAMGLYATMPGFDFGLGTAIYGYQNLYYYNRLSGNIDVLITVPTSLDLFAGFIAGLLIFAIISSRLAILGIWGLAAGAIVGIIGAVLLSWTIHDITTGSETPGTGVKPTPAQQEKIIGDFSNLARAKCDELYPGCSTGSCTGETADKSLQKGYNKCIAAISIAEYTSDENAKNTFDEAKYNDLKNKYLNTDKCLTDGTCTTQQASQQTKDNTTTVITNNTTTVEYLTCDPGYTYNKDQKKCVKECYFPVFGQCLDSVVTLGGLLLGGFIVYKVVSKSK